MTGLPRNVFPNRVLLATQSVRWTTVALQLDLQLTVTLTRLGTVLTDVKSQWRGGVTWWRGTRATPRANGFILECVIEI